jgi:hypothetical protein
MYGNAKRAALGKGCRIKLRNSIYLEFIYKREREREREREAKNMPRDSASLPHAAPLRISTSKCGEMSNLFSIACPCQSHPVCP